MKKVFQLHDKISEEIIGGVICDESQEDDVRTAWGLYNDHYNSDNPIEADIYEFEQQYGVNADFEVIEVDFIQL